MAVTTTCPNCNRNFGINDEEVGHAVRCQFCNRLFMALEMEPEAVDSLEDSRSPRERVAAALPAELIPDNMVEVESGVFMQGAEAGYFYDRPLRKTNLSYTFRIGAKLVTQQAFFSVMYSNPSYFNGPSLPVENVSWHDAASFCLKLTALLRASGMGQKNLIYRLPTEAEWEYACRTVPGESAFSEDGSKSKSLPEYWWGDNVDALPQHAWYRQNSESSTHPVGEKEPNPRGLYDMLGNVGEWCIDWFGPYAEEEVSDPVGPEKGEFKTRRGGTWASIPWRCRVADRVGVDPGCRSALLGFRVVLGPPLIEANEEGRSKTLFA